MYFPYLRGRQFELLALRDLIENDRLSENVIPVVEPVKLSSTLVSMMAEFIKARRNISIISNPEVGSFNSEMKEAQKKTLEAGYRQRFLEQFSDPVIIKSIIMKDNARAYINFLTKKGLNYNDLLIINANRDYLDDYEKIFKDLNPKYVLVPDEGAFRRRVNGHKVLLDDKFEKQDRNADYKITEDEFFSDDHIYYKEDGFVGFSDYSVVGNEYLEAGFAPYAVAIHIVYFAQDKTLRVKHFVSDSNEDITNPAKKFYQAVSKLNDWYGKNDSKVELTLGLKTFLDHFKNQSYPGLGTVKKLSLMHHIELMGRYLSGE